MKTIFLVRHGEPVSGKHRCLGQTDVPLNELGLYQAECLREWFADKSLAAVCSSPSERCVQTAQIIADGHIPMDTWPALRELDCGLWENLSFDDIRKRYPKEYEKRGEHLGTTAPPGGESIMDAGVRFGSCLEHLARELDGDFAVVGHSGASRGFLCSLLGADPDDVFAIPQPYGALSVLKWDGKKFDVLCVGVKPNRWPDDNELKQLVEKYKMSENILAHCLAVANLAHSWAERLEKSGVELESELLCAACKLHDIARAEEGGTHARTGAKLLEKEGYPALAELIRQHHDLEQDASLEARLLFLADKMIRETEKVSLKQRFESSKAKCQTEQALAVWQSRYDTALKAEAELKNMLAVDAL